MSVPQERNSSRILLTALIGGLGLVLAAGCPPASSVELMLGNAVAPPDPFVALPESGGDLEMTIGGQGADMVRPAVRIGGVDDPFVGGRVRLTLLADGEEITGSTEQLRDLIDGGDGYLYHWQMFLPFPGIYNIPDMIGVPAMLRGEVIGGGYAGLVEIEVTLVDDIMEEL